MVGVTLTLEDAGSIRNPKPEILTPIPGKEEKFETDVALVAVGRRARTEDLGLEKVPYPPVLTHSIPPPHTQPFFSPHTLTPHRIPHVHLA